MGYACPVCGTPQVDGRHLANHVAFSALTGDDAHDAWLDEHVPEWGELGEDDLAERVVPLADEADVADAFDEGSGGRTAVDRRAAPAPDRDEEAARILDEAGAFTRQMEQGGEEDGEEEFDGASGSGGRDGADSVASADETE